MPADLPLGTRGTFRSTHAPESEYSGQVCTIVEHHAVWDYLVEFRDKTRALALRTAFTPLPK